MNTRFITRTAILSMLLIGLLAASFSVALPAQAADNSASVDVDALNLRTGPGFRYAIFKVLPQGQALTLLGRSTDGVWVEVRLPNGSGGWVYASYLRTSVTISKLPITQAAGGPTDPGPTTQTYSLYMTIVDNQATVTLKKYPANASVVVKLGRAGGSADLVVAEAATDANGAAQISFPMPRTWADGSPLNETDLVLVAATTDGKFSRTASIQYYR